MTKIDFKNGQAPYLSDKILNQLQLNIENAIAEAKLESKKEENPIGHIRLELTDTNPATYLGFGTWELYAKGQVLVGVNPDDTDYNTAEKTGGKKTIKLSTSQLPAHSHKFTGKAHSHGLNNHTHSYAKANANTNNHTLTVAEIPSHKHSATNFIYNSKDNPITIDTNGSSTLSVATSNVSVGATGGGGGHNHPIGTTNTNTGGSTANTTNATAEGTIENTGSGEDIDIRQEYITCYMWKRVA